MLNYIMSNVKLRFGLYIILSLINLGIIRYIANFIVEKEIQAGQKLLEELEDKEKK